MNENARVIHDGVPKGRMSVCVAQKSKSSGRNSNMSNEQKGSKMSGNTVQTIVCFGCGKPGHRVYTSVCPAKQATCGLCHQVGHFKAFCHSKGHSSTPGGGSSQKEGLSSSNKCLCFPTRRADDIKSTGSQTPGLPVLFLAQFNCSTWRLTLIQGRTVQSLLTQFSTLTSQTMSSMTFGARFSTLMVLKWM